MNTLEFISSIVHAVAWPVAAVVIVVVLRRSIGDLLTVPLKRLTVTPTGIDVAWQEQTGRVVENLPSAGKRTSGEEGATLETAFGGFAHEMLDLIEQASPIAAVAACEQRIGQELRAMLQEAGVTGLDGLAISDLARRARDKDLINEATVNSIDGLVVMHTLALLDGGGARLDLAKAREYIGLTEAVLYVLRTTRGL